MLFTRDLGALLALLPFPLFGSPLGPFLGLGPPPYSWVKGSEQGESGVAARGEQTYKKRQVQIGPNHANPPCMDLQRSLINHEW